MGDLPQLLELVILLQPRKVMRKLHRDIAKQLDRRFYDLATNPRPDDSKDVSEAENLYCVREAGFYVYYAVWESKLVINLLIGISGTYGVEEGEGISL